MSYYKTYGLIGERTDPIGRRPATDAEIAGKISQKYQSPGVAAEFSVPQAPRFIEAAGGIAAAEVVQLARGQSLEVVA